MSRAAILPLVLAALLVLTTAFYIVEKKLSRSNSPPSRSSTARPTGYSR